MGNKFILCGTVGWCLELVWTGLHTISKKDHKLMGQSSLWMFPIYGLASCICPMARHMRQKHFPLLLRGTVYTAGIFAAEYSTGYLLKKRDLCPWDYSKCPGNIDGLIRLDYAPVWFATGLLYEKILTPKSL